MPEASIQWGTGFSSAWSNVATFIPKFVVFLIILIVGYIMAKAIAKILSAVLTRVGFDRLVERGGIKTALEPQQLRRLRHPGQDRVLRDHAVRAVHRVRRVREQPGQQLPARSRRAYLPLIFVAIVIIAALDQLRIAANVVNAILYAALAALIGIAIVAIGGGGIKTMSQRWEAVADRYDEEKPRIAAALSASSAPSLREQARQAMPDDGSSSYGGATATRAQPVADSYRQSDGGYPDV